MALLHNWLAKSQKMEQRALVSWYGLAFAGVPLALSARPGPEEAPNTRLPNERMNAFRMTCLSLSKGRSQSLTLLCVSI